MKSVFLALVLIAAVSGCATSSGQKADAIDTLGAEQRAKNVESLRLVLEILRDTNWREDVADLDIDALLKSYGPRIGEAETMTAARQVFTELFEGFGQSHLGIIPAEVYNDMEVTVDDDGIETTDAPEEDEGVPGISVRPYGGSMLITAVEPDSPAADAGLHAGQQIVAIDGEKLKPLLRKMEDTLGDKSMRTLMMTRAIETKLRGPIDDPVKLRIKGMRGEVAVERALPRGKPFAFGNLPAIDTWIEHRWLDDNTGYIAFNYFMDPPRLAPAFQEAIYEFSDAQGVIVDLRGNGGGIAALAMGFAGWFVSERGALLGTMYFRDADLRFNVNARPGAYTGPVAILIDGCSASCSEIFAAGLRDLGRARLFGTVTAGAALPAHFRRLPNGDGFMYPVADYVSKDGDRLEGVGVVPDVIVPYDPAELLAGQDPILEAAQAWIRTKNN